MTRHLLRRSLRSVTFLGSCCNTVWRLAFRPYQPLYLSAEKGPLISTTTPFITLKSLTCSPKLVLAVNCCEIIFQIAVTVSAMSRV
jgi:hypothetical protein